MFPAVKQRTFKYIFFGTKGKSVNSIMTYTTKLLMLHQNYNVKYGVPLSQGHAHFSSGWDFMMASGKPQMHAKFEVASFSSCRNIKGNPQIWGSSPRPQSLPLFLPHMILWWAVANPSCVPNLKSLASVVAETLKGVPKILGSSPNPGPCLLFLRGGILWWA